ncbi:MAG: glycosyltransferase family 4 protein [Chloroflexi bacterium]|nr:glycosyltransferase family 4 protein [Chloroflexota bacterium]
MHVLMLCALDVWALRDEGGAPSLYRTLQAYGERRHRVTLVSPTIGANAQLASAGLRSTTPTEPPDIPGVTYERFHLPSFQESRLPLPPLARAADQKLRFALLFPYLASRRAASVLDRKIVDVIYGYEVHGVLAMRLLKRKHRLPTVARFQGTVLHPHVSNRLALLRRYEEVLALRTDADRYIMTNDGTRGDEVLARLNPTSTDRLSFWRNGLDLDRLRPVEPAERVKLREKLDSPTNAFTLLTASRLSRWKRVDRAIDAMPEIVRSLPDPLLVVLGDGEERQNLELQARDLGVEAHVRFVGSVQQKQVASYMGAADVFLAPADLSNVGNPLLEAMSCGLPIVTVDAGDTKDLIRDGATGRLLPNGEPGAIANAVVQLGNDESLRCALGAGARREAEKRFWTWEERMDAELEIVEALVHVEQTTAGT